tara:strand:- start:9375 stop:10538 length:1164 start_codon:yes stop_codon:yes gene_type:complete
MAASIAAMAGLAYLGQLLSEPKIKAQPSGAPQSGAPQSGAPQGGAPQGEVVNFRDSMPDKKMEVANFGVLAPQSRTDGSEILNMRNRIDTDFGRMNNLSPVEKQLVGPGLGVSPDTPAFGGHQQLFRVNPENVGAYRLTTLPGRSGPAMDVKGGRRGVVGEVSHNRPEKTAFLPARRPESFGRAQGMSGVVPRGEHENTKRLTNRSVTGQRDDGLGFPGAKRLVSAATLAQDPTRNKKDGNIEHHMYNNQVTPGINYFAHGYTNSPATKIGEKRVYGTQYTVSELGAYGFRPDERRGKPNRMSNAGRMNVRAGGLNQGGMPTAARVDTGRLDGRVAPVNGAWSQQYTNDSFHRSNAYKGNTNPYATQESLSVASKQMQNNPIAQKIC